MARCYKFLLDDFHEADVHLFISVWHLKNVCNDTTCSQHSFHCDACHPIYIMDGTWILSGSGTLVVAAYDRYTEIHSVCISMCEYWFTNSIFVFLFNYFLS